MIKQMAWALVLVAAPFAGVAGASQMNGYVGFFPAGSASFSPTSGQLQNASSITFATSNKVSFSSGLFANSGAVNVADLSALNLPSASLSLTGIPLNTSFPATLTTVNLSSFISFGTGSRFVFDLTKLGKWSGGYDTINFYGTGTLHDTLGVYEDSPAAFSLNGSTQSGMTTWSYSGTFSANGVPEPASLALMAIGSLALVRRRRSPDPR